MADLTDYGGGMAYSTVRPQVSSLECQLCGARVLRPLFSEKSRGLTYTSYHCRKCDLFQTLGDIAPVSPDYVDLTQIELDDSHVFLQTEHKKTAFDQWRALTKRDGNGGRRLLDIGCGVGGFLDYAAGHGWEVYGFDASAAQADRAAARHVNVRNAVDLDNYVASLAVPASFDVITMWDVFEHIRDPAALIAGVRRHLAPGGLFFVSVPNGAANPIKVRIARLRGRDPGLIPWEHVFYYTRGSLARMLTDAGLAVTRIGSVVPYLRPLGLHEVVRRAVFQLLAGTRYSPQIFAVAKNASIDPLARA